MRVWQVLSSMFSVLCASITFVVGADFRIENRVYAGTEKEPISESLTLFQAGQVYDFLTEPAETTVLDAQHGRIVLLDRTRQMRTEIKTGRLVELIASMKIRAAQSSDPLLKFLANPEFDEQFEAETGVLELTSPLVTYRVETEPAPSAEVVAQLRYFSSWYAQLNAILQPGGLPPFARAQLDETLRRRQLVPQSVELTIERGRLPPRTQVLRSEHKFTSRLLDDDIRRIEQAHDAMASFRHVTLELFRQPPVAGRPAGG